jgi:hypothetical protein
MSGIGDPKGAGSIEVAYRSLEKTTTDRCGRRLGLRLFDDQAPLWLLVGRRVRLVAPRQAQRQT